MRAKLLPILVILGVLSAGFVFTLSAVVQQQHCVAEVQAISAEVIPFAAPNPVQCFDTPAEAVAFATGGEISPDRSASPEEIGQLIREYDDGLERQ